jgi:hypothetical protein
MMAKCQQLKKATVKLEDVKSDRSAERVRGVPIKKAFGWRRVKKRCRRGAFYTVLPFKTNQSPRPSPNPN